MAADKLQFDGVHGKYRDKIHRYLQRMVGGNDAEDLTQEVFVRIDKGLTDFKGQSSLSTWVYRIATNAALDRMKSRAAQEDRKTVTFDTLGEEAEVMSVCTEEKSLSAERQAIRNEMTECIREFVDKLAPDYRTVIILSEIKDLKNREIAEILGISLDAVKIRLHRARAGLKAAFEAGCEFYRDEDGGLACDRKKTEKPAE